ncbi:uncharacterized protein LOC106514704 [Austrofundulus limnaeus]|uniref:Uncharacterized protein LOC106514704 n=1 Tax=Austrofundulus limnaeus TaxID=52670 RepID=A0A2I4AVP3_AUSLI|nr:PREDICTED: uncharacterized protein LOC106514704 [Austrofundulus limnaeus]
MFLLSVILLQVFHALGVKVTEGVEWVQLPCQVLVSVSNQSTVVWSREDLKFSTIHIRQQSGDDLGEQNQRFNNRTWMKEDALRTGDLSLTLRTPTVSDSETYTCTVRRFGQELSRINVPLKVTEPPPLWPKVVSPVLVLLFVLAAVFGLIFYCRYLKNKVNPAYKLQLVRAVEGQVSVLLPCRTRTRLPPNASVEWRRIDPETVVHVYPVNQCTTTYNQDENDQNRTKMRWNPLKTRDLSLTLYNPSQDDSGLYICTVQKDGCVLKQRVVSLCVKGCSVQDTDPVSDVNSLQDIWRWILSGNIDPQYTLRQSLRSSAGPSLNHLSHLSSYANGSDSEDERL